MPNYNGDIEKVHINVSHNTVSTDNKDERQAFQCVSAKKPIF
jgi:hypothetical protein